MSRVAVIGIAGNSAFLPVERFHVGGETIEAESVRFEPGGKGFNQAVAAARAGSEVSFLAAVGDDCPGSIYDILAKDGIDACLVKKPGNTAFASVITDKAGNNRVTVFQGVQLTVKDVAAFADKIRMSDVLLLNNEVPADVNAAAADIASKAGKTIILNPAPAKELPEDFLKKITYFTPNQHETAGIEGFSNIIQTLGGDGCFIKKGKFTVSPIGTKAVDTTGAGDTFSGYLAAFTAAGRSLRTAVQYANAASGISVTGHGAVSSIPYVSSVLELYSGKIRCTERTTQVLREGVVYENMMFENRLGQHIPVFSITLKAGCGATLRVEAAPQGQRRILPEHREELEKKGFKVLAITNAGYFQLAAKTYLSHGIQICDGNVYSLPTKERPNHADKWFGVTSDGKYVISDTDGYESVYKGRLMHAVCGGPVLIKEGKTVCNTEDIVPEPRTFLGFTENGDLVLAVADGRSVKSAGLTYGEETEVLKEINPDITEAINLDGGGSSAMLIADGDGYRLVNEISDGDYRPVADTLAVVI